MVSLPVRGAWIEMLEVPTPFGSDASLPVRGAWIEISIAWLDYVDVERSLPVRGARIEICVWRLVARLSFVAPCEGSED